MSSQGLNLGFCYFSGDFDRFLSSSSLEAHWLFSQLKPSFFGFLPNRLLNAYQTKLIQGNETKKYQWKCARYCFLSIFAQIFENEALKSNTLTEECLIALLILYIGDGQFGNLYSVFTLSTRNCVKGVWEFRAILTDISNRHLRYWTFHRVGPNSSISHGKSGILSSFADQSESRKVV